MGHLGMLVKKYNHMKVLKFGGTSVGTPENMRKVADLIQSNDSKIVVLSAVAGTTNTLVEVCDHVRSSETALAKAILEELREKYNVFIANLYLHPLSTPLAWNVLEEHFERLNSLINQPYSVVSEKEILAQGELISTKLFHYLLLELGIENTWLPALEFMRLNEMDEPDLEQSNNLLEICLAKSHKSNLYITQGYICRNHEEEIDNLKRGGSDYTATIIGAILDAEEIQIWTDIDGVHNNDPRVVEDTFPIKNLSYREAAELAYFGAKILHPTCVLPAEKQEVPIRLKNTMDPGADGTLISDKSSGKVVTAIAAKDGITMINIHSHRMLNAYGFLRQVFEVFETHRTPIDMITTSEVAVSLTIDQNE